MAFKHLLPVVAAPADGSTVRADPVTVRGTVTPSDASVQVVGQSAQVGNGVFTTSVPLKKGRNTIRFHPSHAPRGATSAASTPLPVRSKSSSRPGAGEGCITGPSSLLGG
jgi:hypothetical protein